MKKDTDKGIHGEAETLQVFLDGLKLRLTLTDGERIFAAAKMMTAAAGILEATLGQEHFDDTVRQTLDAVKNGTLRNARSLERILKTQKHKN